MPEHAVERLLRVLTDRDERTVDVLRALCHRGRLSEADVEVAREAASDPAVGSPARVAVAVLKQRAERSG